MSWEKVKLGDIADTSSGGTPNREVKEYWVNGNIPWIKSGQLKDCVIDNAEEFITEVALKKSSAKVFKNGTLLLALYGATAGKLGFLGLDAATNQAICSIVPKNNKLNTRYLYYFLLSQRNKIIGDSTGGAQPNISQYYVKNIDIPLPPLHIQKHIADVLDKADALRQKDQQLLQKYDELAQSIFYDMFGDPVKNEKGWEVKRLGEVSKQITDGTHFSPPSVDEGIPYITAKHVKNYGVDFYLAPTYVSEEEHKKIYSRCKPELGDILYIKDGATTGIAAINEYDFEFSMLSSLALIKPDYSYLTSFYLRFWLNNPKVKDLYLSEFMSGAAIKRFTLQKIKSFRILVPPIELQNDFVKKLIQISSSIKIVDDNLSLSSNLFNTLLNNYFSNN
jgi:type I restriction enzyme S subunit